MKKCPNPGCGRLSEDFESCGAKLSCAIVLGAVPKEVSTSGKDVILECDHCETTRVVAAKDLATGQAQTAALMSCKLGIESCVCKARIPQEGDQGKDNSKAHVKAAKDGALKVAQRTPPKTRPAKVPQSKSAVPPVEDGHNG